MTMAGNLENALTVIRRTAALCGLLLLASFASGCTALKLQQADPPKVTLTSLELTGMTLFEQDFNLGLRLTNPNDFALPIAGLSYTIKLNGEEFANGATNQSVTVPALGDAVVHLTVHANMLGNLQQFRRWQSNPPDKLDYALSGKLSLKGVPFGMPFDYTGTVPLN